MISIIPSVVTNSKERMNEIISSVEDVVDRIQLDVVDGKFAPNKSVMFDFELDTKLFVEAHLMVEDPIGWVEKNYSKVDIIIAHVESMENPKVFIDLVKSKGKKVGLAIMHGTKVEKILEFLDELDVALVLSVKPGFYGSKFIPEMMDVVKAIREKNSKIDIEVDGHMNDKTIPVAKKNGANLFSVGSYISNSDDPAERVRDLLRIC